MEYMNHQEMRPSVADIAALAFRDAKKEVVSQTVREFEKSHPELQPTTLTERELAVRDRADQINQNTHASIEAQMREAASNFLATFDVLNSYRNPESIDLRFEQRHFHVAYGQHALKYRKFVENIQLPSGPQIAGSTARLNYYRMIAQQTDGYVSCVSRVERIPYTGVERAGVLITDHFDDTGVVTDISIAPRILSDAELGTLDRQNQAVWLPEIVSALGRNAVLASTSADI